MKRRERGDRYSATNSKSFKARREEPLIHAGEKERRRNASREAKGNGEERKVAESPEENTARLNNRRRKRKKREERGGREREREREKEREEMQARRAANRQRVRRASRYPVLLAIRALDGTQRLFAAGSSAHAGPLICDPDPPYLSNPEYGFHLNSGRSEPRPHAQQPTYCAQSRIRVFVYTCILGQDLHEAHEHIDEGGGRRKKKKEEEEEEEKIERKREQWKRVEGRRARRTHRW